MVSSRDSLSLTHSLSPSLSHSLSPSLCLCLSLSRCIFRCVICGLCFAATSAPAAARATGSSTTACAYARRCAHPSLPPRGCRTSLRRRWRGHCPRFSHWRPAFGTVPGRVTHTLLRCNPMRCLVFFFFFSILVARSLARTRTGFDSGTCTLRRAFRFVPVRLVWFGLVLFRFVSFCFVSFCFVSFHFISFPFSF